uniref:Uncharacterized protein n=1 Tax=Helianthus annuus TaxID=4232 RepID=A0A251VKA0_HELAN
MQPVTLPPFTTIAAHSTGITTFNFNFQGLISCDSAHGRTLKLADVLVPAAGQPSSSVRRPTSHSSQPQSDNVFTATAVSSGSNL